MNRLLIVEDSKTLAAMMSRKIRSELRFDRDIASTFRKARELIEQNQSEYFVAVVDLHLPDAPKGETVDYVLHKNIPVIVFTSHFSDETRETMMAKNVVDYVLKEGGPEVIDYLVQSIDRFHKNRFTRVMIVDDSRTSRKFMKSLLETQKFIVVEAGSGEEALSLLQEYPDTKLVISDYNMPGMDGSELVARIRKTHPKNKLAIIGVSAYGTSLLSARFLKSGASDFLSKPFLEEELYCRINQNIEMLEHIETINNISNIDYLTGICNRRYLFQAGQKLYENAKRGNLYLTAAIIDIDGLGAINDKYGFEIGDIVLREIARLVHRNFRAADIVTRFGGEGFCVLAANMNRKNTRAVFDRIRSLVENKKIRYEDFELSVTVSIGVTTKFGNSLEDMVKHANALRTKAKEKGRNCVVVE